MLKLKNVSKYYHSNEVVALGLRKVSLDFELGEFVAVTGESGSGKSTLLNVISGLDTYEDGEMYVGGEETSYFSVSEWESYRRQYIGFVFQNYNIIDSYSVLENVMVALKIQGYDKEKRKDRALELIKKVGLESHTHHKASKLSGGQKQRAVIARALAKDCPIIVCDEPTGNLDSESSATVMGLLQEISKDKLVIVVTHNYDEVEEYATRKIRLFDGEVVEDKRVKSHKIVEKKAPLKSFVMNTGNLLSIASTNILKTPRRSIFTTTVFIFIVAVFTLIYGFFVNITSEAGGSSYNNIFSNVTDNRIIVTKFDESAFTQTEIDRLKAVNKVIDVYNHDVVNDSTIKSFLVYSDEWWTGIDQNEYYVNPSYVFTKTDLSEGELPSSEFEVIIEKNDQYKIGDKIYFGYDYIYGYDETATESQLQAIIEENTIEFTVVGTVPVFRQFDWTKMVYFHKDFFNSPTVIEHGYLTDSWRSSPLTIMMYIDDMQLNNLSYLSYEIDNTLSDGEVEYGEGLLDMLQWQYLETHPEIDPEVTPDYYKDIDFEFRVNSTFHDKVINIKVVDLITRDDMKERELIRMNQATYDSLFVTETFQVTAYVSDSFDGKLVKTAIEDAGFNAIYPRNVQDPFSQLGSLILSIVFGGLMVVLMIIMYFITYLVLRNIQESKKKDFLILRSIGASKTSLNKITIIELFFAMIFGIIFVFTLLYVNTQFGWVKWLVDLLGYYSLSNYLFLGVLMFALAFLLGRRFNSRIFNKSVISSLKAE